jgi:CRP-like cAMP-binding protein
MEASLYKRGTPLLTSDERASLERVGQTIQRERGYVFIREGEDTDHALLIQKGHVQVTAGEPPRLIAIRGAGEIVGEMAGMTRRPRSANIEALDDVEVLLVPADRWLEFLYKHPRAMHAQLVAKDERLEQATRRIAESDLAVEQRLAKVLVELTEVGLGASGKEGVVLRHSQQDLARLIGASPDSVKKIIRLFKARGIVTTGRQATIIADLPALRDVAGGRLADSS